MGTWADLQDHYSTLAEPGGRGNGQETHLDSPDSEAFEKTLSIQDTSVLVLRQGKVVCADTIH